MVWSVGRAERRLWDITPCWEWAQPRLWSCDSHTEPVPGAGAWGRRSLSTSDGISGPLEVT